MRRGELLGLRWSDLDLDQGWLSVRQALVVVDRQVQVSEPKTVRGRRLIALDPGIVTALRAHRAGRPLSGSRSARAGLQVIWCSPARTVSRCTPTGSAAALSGAPAAPGCPRPASTTCATLALQAGMHPKVISERLGHSTVAMTLDIYSHAIPALQHNAAATIADLVSGAATAAGGLG